MVIGTPETRRLSDPELPVHWLIGRRCWGVAAGAKTGSMFSLHLGEKVRRKRPLDNPALLDPLRTHEGEVILFVECRWSLTYKKKRLCTSASNNHADGEMVVGLRRLVGARVTNLTLSIPSNDLALHLTKDLTLSISARLGRTGGSDNYSLATPLGDYIVGPDLHVRFEPRKGALLAALRTNSGKKAPAGPK